MSSHTAQPPRSAGTGTGAGADIGTGRPGTGHGSHGEHTAAAWAKGGSLLAGVLMLVAGVMDILQGIIAIARDTVYAFGPNYVYSFNLVSWGWIHVIIGALVALAGIGVLAGSRVARMAGIVLAGLNVIAQFMFLPYAPVWAFLSLAVSIFVIWALAYRPHRVAT